MLKTASNWLTVVFAGIAAVLWFTSTIVSVSAKRVEEERVKQTCWSPTQIVSEGADFVETAQAQARWNRWAAAATGLAALFQAISTAIPGSVC
jgi:hypothetical protein